MSSSTESTVTPIDPSQRIRRDLFAAAALQGLLAKLPRDGGIDAEEITEDARNIADWMMLTLDSPKLESSPVALNNPDISTEVDAGIDPELAPDETENEQSEPEIPHPDDDLRDRFK